MSNFYGKSFVFNDIPSETYGLFVINFGSSSSDKGSGGADVQLFLQEIYRRPKPYLFGVSQKPTLEFEFTFGSEQPLSAEMRSVIEGWLFGQLGYKKLQIVQDDLLNVYFNCFLTNPQIYYVGNVAYGFTCKVICDLPWGLEFSKSLTRTYGGGVANETIVFFNGSANNDYLFPIFDFAVSAVGNSITVTNNSDNARIFAFTGLTANSVINVDNDLKIIQETLGGGLLVPFATNVNIISKFNKNWFRLVPGYNQIQISGGISYLTMTYQFARKVGG